MRPPKCRLCGSEHYGVAHVFASNNDEHLTHASNTGSDRAGVGIPLGEVGDRKSVEGKPADVAVRVAEDDLQRKQRWSRDKYNAYQREYMRKRRARSA